MGNDRLQHTMQDLDEVRMKEVIGPDTFAICTNEKDDLPCAQVLISGDFPNHRDKTDKDTPTAERKSETIKFYSGILKRKEQGLCTTNFESLCSIPYTKSNRFDQDFQKWNVININKTQEVLTPETEEEINVSLKKILDKLKEENGELWYLLEICYDEFKKACQFEKGRELSLTASLVGI
jgi:hypothetical protein